MKFSKHLYALAIAGVVSIAIPNTTQAGLTFELQEVGSNVVLSYVSGGSIDLTGLGTGSTSASTIGKVSPSFFIFASGSSGYDWYTWSWVSPVPSNFGSGSYLASSSDSGGFLGFGAGGGVGALAVPVNYSSGPINISSTSTWTGQSFATMGITAGTYVWTLANTDTITLQVGPASPVPEASGSVAGLGLAMAGLYQLRRRKAAGKVVEG